MRRRLFNAAVFVSLLACALALAAFARSLRWTDHFELHELRDEGPLHYRWYVWVISGRGGIGFARDAEVMERRHITAAEAALPTGEWRWQHFHSRPPRYPTPGFDTRGHTPLGFWFKWSTTPDTVRREIIVPYGFLVILTGALPALWLARRRRERVRRRRVEKGLCPNCGYDLRANTGACPECGGPVRDVPADRAERLPPAVEGITTGQR